MQPLDLTVFNILKRKYRKEIAKFVSLDLDNIRRPQFITAYRAARDKAFTAGNITAGWRKSGIYPYNILEPLSNPHVKDPSAIKRPDTPKNIPTQPNPPRGGTVMTERDERVLIRNQAQRIEELEAENAFLKARLKIANEALEST